MHTTIHKTYLAERKDPRHPSRALSALRTARALFLAERLEYEGRIRFDVVPDDHYDREDWDPDPNNPETYGVYDRDSARTRIRTENSRYLAKILKERDSRDRCAIGVVAEFGEDLDIELPELPTASLFGLTDDEEEYGLRAVKEEVGCQVLMEWLPRYPRLAPLLLGYDNLETLKKDLGL